MGKFSLEAIYNGDPTACHLQEMTCDICQCLFDDAVQFPCTNSHVFCKDCVSSCDACPNCREPLPAGKKKGKSIQEVNKPLSRMMNRLPVRCPYHDLPSPSYDRIRPSRDAGGVIDAGADEDPSPSPLADVLPSSSSTDKKHRPGRSSLSLSSAADADGTRATDPAHKRRRVEQEDANNLRPLLDEPAVIPELVSNDTPTDDDEYHCTWTGEYGDLLAHHLRVCPFHFVKCPEGCGAQIRRKDVEKHLKSCESCLVSCEICGMQLKKDELAAHNEDHAQLHVSILQKRLTDRSGQGEDVAMLTQRLTALEELSKGFNTAEWCVPTREWYADASMPRDAYVWSPDIDLGRAGVWRISFTRGSDSTPFWLGVWGTFAGEVSVQLTDKATGARIPLSTGNTVKVVAASERIGKPPRSNNHSYIQMTARGSYCLEGKVEHVRNVKELILRLSILKIEHAVVDTLKTDRAFNRVRS
ncbi:unnamed protein product [Amoebophrya sp. A120]|nr:unnamed protein product [Amoebophrya sp. A120]|eukprot:GSA120T00001569001.1